MATAIADALAASRTQTGPLAATSAAQIQDRFLTLLVTQLKNQDPLRPMDNAQITTQLSQISTVSGIGKKKAERLVLELHDRFEEVGGELPPASMGPSEEALAALTRLGYPPAQAESAVRDALAADGSSDTAQLIKQALQRLAGKR